jgi:hypothetical protein
MVSCRLRPACTSLHPRSPLPRQCSVCRRLPRTDPLRLREKRDGDFVVDRIGEPRPGPPANNWGREVLAAHGGTRGVEWRGQERPSSKARRSRTSASDPSMPASRSSMPSSRPSSAGPRGVPFEVETERRIWRIPTMKVSSEPATEENAAISAAPIPSLMRASGSEDP